MNIKDLLKKYRLKQKDLAQRLGYTAMGISVSIKNGKNVKGFEDSTKMMALEKRGINIDALLDTLR